MNPIEAALAGATDTREVRVAHAALDAAGGMFGRCFGASPAVVIADEITFGLAGDRLEAALGRGRALMPAFVFPGQPTLKADYAHALELADSLRGHDAITVALGSGTVNDLAKLASHMVGRPYVSVATAASVDGYTAFGASITRDGFKQTIACPAPRAVLGDLDLLAAAPVDANASGYGDLLAKVTAGADWLIADALGVEPIDRAGWAMVQTGLRAALAEPGRVRAGDPRAVGRVFEGLVLCGLAMQATRSSRVASGAEHQLSHLWDMGALGVHGDAIRHGFKTGAGAVLVARLYESLLARDLSALDVEAGVAAWPSVEAIEHQVRALFADDRLAAPALAEVRAKHATPDALRARLTRLRHIWPALRARLRAQLLPAAELAAMLRAVGCPADANELGITPTQLRASFAAARLIRRRYTVLDLAVEAGLLDPCLDEMLGAARFEHRR